MLAPPPMPPVVIEKWPQLTLIKSQKQMPSDHKKYVATLEAGKEKPLKWATIVLTRKEVSRASQRAQYNRATRRNTKRLQFVKRRDAAMELMTTDAVFNDVVTKMYRLKEREDCREVGIRRPTSRSFDTTLGLLIDARLKLKQAFVEPLINVDSDGSVHVHWVNNGKEMTLVVPAKSAQPYLYHADQSGFAVDDKVNANSLKTWMEWLVSNGEAQDKT